MASNRDATASEMNEHIETAMSGENQESIDNVTHSDDGTGHSEMNQERDENRETSF